MDFPIGSDLKQKAPLQSRLCVTVMPIIRRQRQSPNVLRFLQIDSAVSRLLWIDVHDVGHYPYVCKICSRGKGPRPSHVLVRLPLVLSYLDLRSSGIRTGSPVWKIVRGLCVISRRGPLALLPPVAINLPHN